MDFVTLNHFNPDHNYNFTLGMNVLASLVEASAPWAIFSSSFSAATAYEDYAANYTAFLASFWNLGKLGLGTVTLFLLDHFSFNVIFMCYLGFNLLFLLFTIPTAKKIDKVPQQKYKDICSKF